MRTCQVAGRVTKGRYRCTRERYHRGPCAAVPVRETSLLRVFAWVVVIAATVVGALHLVFEVLL